MTAKKKNDPTVFELEYGNHRIDYATPFPILLSVNDEPARVINGNGKIVIRKVEGKISLDMTEPKAKYKFVVTSHLTPRAEDLDELPPPQPAPPDNYLQMLRLKVRQQMGVMREEFANHRSPYELGNVDVFEEEEIKSLIEAQKEAVEADKPKEGGDPPSVSETASSDPVSDEKPQEPGNPG